MDFLIPDRTYQISVAVTVKYQAREQEPYKHRLFCSLCYFYVTRPIVLCKSEIFTWVYTF